MLLKGVGNDDGLQLIRTPIEYMSLSHFEFPFFYFMVVSVEEVVVGEGVTQ